MYNNAVLMRGAYSVRATSQQFGSTAVRVKLYRNLTYTCGGVTIIGRMLVLRTQQKDKHIVIQSHFIVCGVAE